MNVYFYSTFNKRDNSTLRPDIVDTTKFTTHDCKLKQDCSEHDPVLLLNSAAFNYVYAYIPDWHKYYYVTDVVSKANNLIEYYLTEDLLASYKVNIANTQARIMYSSNGWDPYLIDSRIQIKNTRQKSDKVTTTPTVPVFERPNGWYLLSALAVCDVTGITTGFGANYIFSPSGIEKVRKWFASPDFMTAFYNYYHGRALDSVYRCIWIPYDIPTGTAEDPQIVGMLSCNIGSSWSGDNPWRIEFDNGECGLIKGWPRVYKSFSIDLGRRYTDFRRSEPYTTGQLYLPGIGLIDVCYGDYAGATSITIMVCIECLTGNVDYRIFAGSNLVQMASTNVAAVCPIGSDTLDSSGVMNGIGTFLGGAVTLAGTIATSGAGVGIAAGAGAMIAGAANTILSGHKHTQTVSGNIGGRMAVNSPYITLTEYTVDTENPNDANYISLQGRPYDGVATIGNLQPTPAVPIYVQCIDAHVKPSELDGITVMKPNMREQQELNNILNSGFYYE
jgi:hypothetical protein